MQKPEPQTINISHALIKSTYNNFKQFNLPNYNM